MVENNNVKQGTRLIDGRMIKTKKMFIEDINVLEVEAGTNGFQGGDSGHGSRTFFKICDRASTDIRVRRCASRFGEEGLEVVLGGDAELRTIIQALKFITDTLEAESERRMGE